jgi:muconate cycloisomerase
MKIDQINIYKILLPFSGDFSHSRKRAPSANNILVEIIADEGKIEGYGEGAPRAYVTGETQESIIEALSDFLQKDWFPWELNDVSQIWRLVDSLPNGKEYNSALCALEMSLLDALGKSQDKALIDYFPNDFYTSKIQYGAAVPLTSRARMTKICRSIKKMNINKIKLKMGKDFEENKGTIEIASCVFGDEYDLKIDVNGVWDRELALKHVPLIKDYNVKVVEQPMMPHDENVAEFAEIMQNYGVVLMADESACSLRDIERIINEGYYRMVNVRLSKCGGFRKSLKIIGSLRRNRVSFQIAAHLGESGVLSAAGRALSLLCRDAVYHDGSYDEYLLKENITVQDVSFGPSGSAGPLGGPGLGVTVSSESLKRLSTDCVSIAR